MTTSSKCSISVVKHAAPAAMATQLTVAGIAAGTPAFMAPEIALAHPEIDGRADLYSLGCVAYYLLTGKFVFAAETPIAAALAHVNDQPVPPSARSPFQIPTRLEALVLQCLAKDPAESGRPRQSTWRIGWREPPHRTPGPPTRPMRGGTSTG
jgi:serine/threonine protein kinase